MKHKKCSGNSRGVDGLNTISIKKYCEVTPLYVFTKITTQNPNLKFPGHSQIVGAPLIDRRQKLIIPHPMSVLQKYILVSNPIEL